MRSMRSAVRTNEDDVRLDTLLERLSKRHQDAKMREASIRIEGTDIQLWATQDVRLTSGRYRVTWRYDVRDDKPIIVCYTLAAT